MSQFERFSTKKARDFATKYASATSEKQLAQSFWRDFFSMICGIDDLLSKGIEFEYPVRSKESGNIRFIDVFWGGVLLIEHKSAGEDLDKAETQARDYLKSLEPAIRPPVFLVSDFQRIRIIDLLEGTRVDLDLADIPDHLDRFSSIISDNGATATKVQTQADIKAAKLMSDLFVEFEKAGYSGHEVSVLLIRVLFLLFGEDTRMFKPTPRGLFTDFVETTVSDGSGLGGRLQELFQVLNTSEERRPNTLPEYVKSFPYVNGGLFAETISIFSFTREMRDALLSATNYDWSLISPAIFGSLFQFARDKETRREMGEHFTSEEFILRCINDLFLNDLNEKLRKCWDSPNSLKKFQRELGTFKFLDPACGSGNFLVVGYKKMRELELKAIARIQELEGSEGQIQIDGSIGLQVHLSQFFGIEYDDWSSSIATVAMHLADHQANLALEEITGTIATKLPLDESAKIVQANALAIDWDDVCPIDESTFIIGNPPFNGARWQSKEQKADTNRVWGKIRGVGNLDYVSNWHLIASRHINRTGAKATFVSTNSIVQGEQPSLIWGELSKLNVEISFAHRAFQWQNEGGGRAAVHVVIMGLQLASKIGKERNLWVYPDIKAAPLLTKVRKINGYLLDAPNILITTRTNPLSPLIPRMDRGSMPNDGGYLSDIDEQEAARIQDSDLIAGRYLRKLIGARELLHSTTRYCLWLANAEPSDIRSSFELAARVKAVRETREASRREATQKASKRPNEFAEIRQPTSEYLAVPLVTSETRDYLPCSPQPAEVIANDRLGLVLDKNHIVFAFLSSRVFMVWNKTVSGRLESRLNFGITTTYNNFPFPNLSDDQSLDIGRAGRAVLEARSEFPRSSLADLYDLDSMPSGLRKAHQSLDREIMKAMEMKPSLSEPEILKELFMRYEAAIKGLI
jgi:hypothetical protein